MNTLVTVPALNSQALGYVEGWRGTFIPSLLRAYTDIRSGSWFWCKKYGFVAKSVKNFTIRKFNHSHHREKWYIKVRIIVSNCGNIIFAPQPKNGEVRDLKDVVAENLQIIEKLQILFSMQN
jgi:hypothetical protein